ncbi:MAG TPA: alanine racemase [Candidatus Limnocylindrales bacterium]
MSQLHRQQGQTPPDPHEFARPNTFEVDLDAISSNVREVRRFVGPGVRVFAALKANAYGFGLLQVAEVMQDSGVDTICVADLSDAVRLRGHGIRIPILLYAGNLVDAPTVRAIEDLSLMATVTDIEIARAYSSLARHPLPVMAKVDVGLERLGLPIDGAAGVIRDVCRLPNLRLEGIYAHLHAAQPAGPPDYVQWQLGRFTAVLDEARSVGVDIGVAAAASTPVLPRYGTGGFNGVDVGRLLYGSLRSDRDATGPMAIRNAFRSLRSRLLQVKPISRTMHLAEAPFPIRPGMRMGIACIGYADGLDFLNCGYALVGGRRAPLLGGPSLEHTRLDLTDIPSAQVGDEVVFVGRQEAAEITPDDVLAHLGLEQPAKMATSVRDSVRRVYLRSDR